MALSLLITGLLTAAGLKGEELVGRAVLPAATFAPGHTSGQQLGPAPINGQQPPFPHQPVQGFSAVLANGDGTFWAMPDNGYGSLENSADFYLRVYRIRPQFKTQHGGAGAIEVLDFIELRDPDKKIPFTVTEHFTAERHLTGADFDIESMQRAHDGTLWFGDEFGPFLIHTDSTGKVIDAPIALPDFDHPGREVRAPQNPFNEEASAIRVMNAVRHHARLHGNSKTPVFSPWYVMINDGNSATGAEHRSAPPAGSGVPAAASDVFTVSSLQTAGYPVVVWTVNDSAAMTALLKLKVNGIITDRPDLLLAAVKSFDANGDGVAGDYLTPDGLIDPAKFDAQGHRGARDLRPENTLPALEAALDYLMTTLEFDCALSRDGIPVLSHDPYLEASKARRADGTPYTDADEVLFKDLDAAAIQEQFIADKIFRGPHQKNDPSLSPVSLAFFNLSPDSQDAATIYRIPRLDQVFQFVEFYRSHYSPGGPGSSHPQAWHRASNAARVRFNIETKLNPRTDVDAKGKVFTSRTHAPEAFVDAIARAIVERGLQDRADIQSFDFRTLLLTQERYPAIRTVYLFGDFPKFADPSLPGSDDGTNLQPQGGNRSPWLAGMAWPYRSTVLSAPFRAQGSGGFEGMALTSDGKALLPLLEKPLLGAPSNTLFIHRFDLQSRTFSGERYLYPLDPRGVAIGDFTMFDQNRGFVIERDSSQGNLNGFKAVFPIQLNGPGSVVAKGNPIDLMRLADPHGISGTSQNGDVGLGATFAMPFTTIEDIIVIDHQHIGVINDNNYPFSVGRHVGTSAPDDTEFILIKLRESLVKGRGDR
jgi:glycerophosphoryl diester phosphodiesterase